MISMNYNSTGMPIDASNAKIILQTLKTQQKTIFSKISKKISTSPSFAECHLSDTGVISPSRHLYMIGQKIWRHLIEFLKEF